MDSVVETREINAEIASGGAVIVQADNSPAGSLLNFVAQALHNPEIDATKLDALLRMQREVAADDAKAQFNRSLHAAQLEMPRVKKNGTVELGTGKGSYRFATYEDVDAICRPIYQKHGFSVTFSSPTKTEQGSLWTATHRHIAGHTETNSMTLPQDTGAGRNALQAAGSTNSYARRYLIEDFYNIVRENADDDGVRGGKVFIDADTVHKIHQELAARKIPLPEFYDAMGIDSLEEIEAKNKVVAWNAIKAFKPRLPTSVP